MKRNTKNSLRRQHVVLKNGAIVYQVTLENTRREFNEKQTSKIRKVRGPHQTPQQLIHCACTHE